MTYIKVREDWQAGPAGGTPVQPDDVEHIEQGIFDVHVDLAAHAADPNLHSTGARLGWIEHAGHSIAAAANINPVHSYGRKIAGLLGTTRYRSIALSGAMAARHTRNMGGDGGWPWVMQNVLRPTEPPLQPRSQLAIVDLGWNDKAVMGPNEVPLREALQAICARYRQALVWEVETAPEWTLSGGAAASGTGGSMHSGTGFATLDATGEKASLSIPSWYDGRKIDLHFLVNAASEGTASVTIDGVPQANLSLNGSELSETGMVNGIVRTYTLAAGAHTIEIGWVSGSVFVDFAGLRVLDNQGPVLVFPKQPHLADYSLYSGYTYPMNDARVDELNLVHDDIAALFPNSLAVELSPVFNKDPKLWTSDAVHPNALGHSVIAAKIQGDLELSGLLSVIEQDAASVEPTAYFEPVFPATATGGRVVFQNGWVNYTGVAGYETAGFRMDEIGNVELKGLVSGGSAGNAVIFTLPVGYRPKANRLFPQYGTAAQRIDVGTDGTVRAGAGGNTALTVLDGIRFQGER